MKKYVTLGIFCLSLLGCVPHHYQSNRGYYGYRAPQLNRQYYTYEQHSPHHRHRRQNPYFDNGPYRKKHHHYH